MKIKNKVLLGALGITALTGGMLLTQQTQASALAYANVISGSYKNVSGTELTGVAMTVDIQTSMVQISKYNDFKIKLDSSNNFKANTNYNINIKINDMEVSGLSKFSINLYNASNELIKTVSYTAKDGWVGNPPSGNPEVSLTASINASEAFYIVLSDTTTVIGSGSLEEMLFNSIVVEEADSVAPTISVYNSDVTVAVGEVTTIAPARFGASATDDRDGSVDTYVKSTNFNGSAVGRYYVILAAKDAAGNEATKEVYINVVDNQKPVINGWEGVYYTNYDSPTTLNDVLSKITAWDETAGNVPVNIVSDGYTGKENVLGNHYVVLSASDGTNTTQITINIIVVDATKPVINGPTALTSNMSSPLTEAGIRAMLSGTDNADTSLSIELVADNFTANKHKAGSYTITYKTVDDSGNESAIHTVTITNKDDIKPIISGESSITAGSATKLSIDEIKSHLNVSDNIDTGLTISVVEDNYSNNYSQVGSHTITFNSTDKSGNVSDIYTLTIVVSDTTKPVITGTNQYTSNMSNPITEAQIRAGLTVTDNVDESLTINLISDGFVGNEQRFGTFEVHYNATDSAGNVSETFVVRITTHDDIAPVITGINEYTISSIGRLDLEHLQKVLDIADNDGKVPTLKLVKDGYSDYSTIVGKYEVSYSATDSNGNESAPFVVTINVVDNIPPQFFIGEDILFVDDTLTLTHQQIVDGLLSQTNINTGMVADFKLETDYFNSPAVANVYSVRATLLMKDGSVNEINGNIQVMSTVDEENPTIDKTDEKEQIEQRARSIWEKIGDFFSNLWKWIARYIAFGWAWDKEEKFIPNW